MGRPTRADKAFIDERRAKNIALRSSGMLFSAIAAELGYADRHAARQDFIRGLESRKAELGEEAATFVAGELEKLDEWERAANKVLASRHLMVSHGKVIWAPQTADGVYGADELDEDGNPVGATYVPLEDAAPVLAAIDRLVKIGESRRKLLDIDPPSKARVEVTNVDSVDADIRRLVAELGARSAGSPAPGAAPPRVDVPVSESTGAGPSA